MFFCFNHTKTTVNVFVWKKNHEGSTIRSVQGISFPEIQEKSRLLKPLVLGWKKLFIQCLIISLLALSLRLSTLPQISMNWRSNSINYDFCGSSRSLPGRRAMVTVRWWIARWGGSPAKSYCQCPLGKVKQQTLGKYRYLGLPWITWVGLRYFLTFQEWKLKE